MHPTQTDLGPGWKYNGKIGQCINGCCQGRHLLRLPWKFMPPLTPHMSRLTGPMVNRHATLDLLGWANSSCLKTREFWFLHALSGHCNSPHPQGRRPNALLNHGTTHHKTSPFTVIFFGLLTTNQDLFRIRTTPTWTRTCQRPLFSFVMATPSRPETQRANPSTGASRHGEDSNHLLPAIGYNPRASKQMQSSTPKPQGPTKRHALLLSTVGRNPR